MLLMSCMYIFVIPSGVGLYCFASSAFQAIEQFILNVISVRKINLCSAVRPADLPRISYGEQVFQFCRWHFLEHLQR